MIPLLAAALGALSLGISSSIMPCPLMTNIAAISYIGRRVDSTRGVLWSGLLYTLGRTTAFLMLGVVIVTGLLTESGVSRFLRVNMYEMLGPILIVAGMLLVELIRFTPPSTGVSESMQRRVDRLGLGGAALLGFVFALSFCPASAAIFFFNLIPLAIENESRFLLPSLFGVGTALPVLFFAALVALNAQWLGKAFDVVQKIAWWGRNIAGWLFIVIGVLFSLKYIFEAI
jgi:cytochrome c-type biogenesis protein